MIEKGHKLGVGFSVTKFLLNKLEHFSRALRVDVILQRMFIFLIPGHSAKYDDDGYHVES